MFNQLLKWTALLAIWNKFKRQIIATLTMFVMLWGIAFLHEDYLRFVKSTEMENASTYIATSFFIKWGVSMMVIIGYVYVLYFFRQRTPKTTQKGKTSAKSSSSSMIQKNSKDPFDAIRKKKKLRSKGDLTINKVRVKRD